MFRKLTRTTLSREEKAFLLDFARKSIQAKLEGKDPPLFNDEYPRLKEPRGAFVTLNKEGKLRGCIGIIAGIKPLYQIVQDVAIAAALNDPRFQPLTLEELPQITIEISVLSPLRKIKNIKKIKIGQHGIYLKLGDAQGLLLPQVAVNNNWNRETFLEHTCLKAGLPRDAWKHPETEIFIFSAEIFEEEANH